MNRLPINLYDLIALGLGTDTWQQFVDRYEEKYNVAQIDGFEFAPIQLSYTFQQLTASTGAHTLPAYVDPESPGYEAALNSITGQTGNIPTMKKFYRLNRTIVRDKLQLIQQVGQAAINSDMASVFTGLIDEGTDGLIGSFMNGLTHQRMQIVSTGHFIIDTTNNPRGGVRPVDIDFLDSDHYDKLTGTARWWTNSDRTEEGAASDPIKYIKSRLRWIRNEKHYNGAMHVEMNKKVYDDLLMHSKVLTRIGRSMYPTVSSDSEVYAAAQNLSDDVIAQKLNVICGVVVKPVDSIAYVDVPDASSHDIVTNSIESFSVTNIAFVPDGKLGTIQGISPLTTGYDPDKVASYDGGRLVLTQRAVPETHSLYIESEAAQLCVPSAAHGMFVSTVTA